MADAALIERGLERAAQQLGDITPLVMREFYRRIPEAEASFRHHAPHDPHGLEAEMVGNTLHYIMRWHEAPMEIRIDMDTSVPHHRVALDVPPDWYRGMIEAAIDVILSSVPSSASDERAAWKQLRDQLVSLVERNRHI